MSEGSEADGIVAAGPAHAAVLAVLSASALGNAWSPELVARQLAAPGGHGWLALRAGAPCAFILLRRAADEAEILALATLPAHRRQGHARCLVRTATACLARRGVARLYLEVAADNCPARALYRSLGFAEIGRRRGYYRREDGTIDALVMALPVHPT
ncbi:MAG: GNAT family N-acetyltransferase [Azospirillaceae bacterium]